MDHTPILPPEAFAESAELFLPSNVGIGPLSAVARALAGFNRDQLGSTVEVLIALMDIADGDVDAEEDDPAGQSDEDGINTGGVPQFGWGGPSGAGCPISDPGGCQYD